MRWSQLAPAVSAAALAGSVAIVASPSPVRAHPALLLPVLAALFGGQGGGSEAQGGDSWSGDGQGDSWGGGWGGGWPSGYVWTPQAYGYGGGYPYGDGGSPWDGGWDAGWGPYGCDAPEYGADAGWAPYGYGYGDGDGYEDGAGPD